MSKGGRRATRVLAVILGPMAVLAVGLVGCSLMGGSGQPKVFEFDLEQGLQGFEAGFADLPADYDPSSYNLSGAYSALPDYLGAGRSAVLVTGSNHSDDLFMFLKRQVDGLAPSTSYRVEFEVDIASNGTSVPGIGGSPGDSVWLKAGASPVEPVAAPQDGYLRMNIDTGIQAEGGDSAAVLGTIAVPGEEAVYQEKSLSGPAGGLVVTSDAQGRLWLIVGTDSGFEGQTALYYLRIRATLTP